MILHVNFCAGDEESSGLMQRMKPCEIDVAAIHHVNGAGLPRDQIQRERIAHFAVGNMDKAWDWAAQIKQRVCILTAAFVERKSAHGNSDKHRSIVVLSSA